MEIPLSKGVRKYILKEGNRSVDPTKLQQTIEKVSAWVSSKFTPVHSMRSLLDAQYLFPLEPSIGLGVALDLLYNLPARKKLLVEVRVQ